MIRFRHDRDYVETALAFSGADVDFGPAANRGPQDTDIHHFNKK